VNYIPCDGNNLKEGLKKAFVDDPASLPHFDLRLSYHFLDPSASWTAEGGNPLEFLDCF
jgi:hypothetical protein